MIAKIKSNSGVTKSAHAPLRLVLLPLALLCAQVSNFQAQSNTNQQQQGSAEVAALELGKLIEREIVGGQKHSYTILLLEGQYMRVEIKPQGINLGVTLQLPDGETHRLSNRLRVGRSLL